MEAWKKDPAKFSTNNFSANLGNNRLFGQPWGLGNFFCYTANEADTAAN